MFDVAPAEPSDVSAVAEILDELDRFYGASSAAPIAERAERIRTLLFGDTPAAFVLLARTGVDVAGMAAYSFLWPAAGITHSLFLKELYVKQTYWRRGVGTALMRKICEIALANQCSRVEWMTETTNLEARRFYDALDAPPHPEKIFYRLEGEDIGRIISAPSGLVVQD